MALSACNPATSDSGDGSTPSEASSGNEVSKDSARVLLSEVGKNVADGVIQVDPSTIQGRILVFDDYSKLEGKKVCIGFYNPPKCIGIYIEKDKEAKNNNFSARHQEL